MKCQHYDCRCARANELAVMAERLDDARLLAEAVALHDAATYVECRREEKRDD